MDNALWMQQNSLRLAYVQARRRTLDLVQGLSAEDCMLQSMEMASPVKWQLAHTTWFFESFVLARAQPHFKPFNESWLRLFNSYYLSLGEPHARARRGLLSRPSLDEVLAWRERVDTQMLALLSRPLEAEFLALTELGINHEEQHQELLLTDVKHHFFANPLHPVYREMPAPAEDEPPFSPGSLNYRICEGGLAETGHSGTGFGFDNEMPRHRIWLPPFELATRLVTNAEYLAFMVDGGYGRPELWLSDGWERRTRENWHAPLYWFRQDDAWCQYTLTGVRPLRRQEPVCHVSYYEADAYARWARARLPSEAEWEYAAERWLAGQREASAADVSLLARTVQAEGGDASAMADRSFGPNPEAANELREVAGRELQLHPAPLENDDLQLFGTVWQWTQSAYLPYPGYRAAPGAVGEYNGKFMSNQMVLRGSSCVTPPRHMRLTYRNFFPPLARWQFSGIRLARDLPGAVL
jgi:ergothioneine biosynthesis protein EgtB